MENVTKKINRVFQLNSTVQLLECVVDWHLNVEFLLVRVDSRLGNELRSWLIPVSYNISRKFTPINFLTRARDCLLQFHHESLPFSLKWNNITFVDNISPSI